MVNAALGMHQDRVRSARRPPERSWPSRSVNVLSRIWLMVLVEDAQGFFDVRPGRVAGQVGGGLQADADLVKAW